MAEEKIPKTKVQSEQLSDSDTPDEEADPRLCTSEEERIYGMIRGSAQATQVALSLQEPRLIQQLKETHHGDQKKEII